MKWFTKAKLILTGVLMLFVGISVQAAVPHITGIDMAGGKPRLSIQSDPGITNQIQCATNLSDANWAVLTNILVAQSNYEFVDEGTASLPRRFYRVAGFPTNDVPPETMALIPGGSFEMGGTFSESYINEFPVHTVYVSAFYMDRCVVTKALWDEVFQWATNHGYSFDYPGWGKATSHPAHTITWYDAAKWCNARSEKEGRAPAFYTDSAQRTVYRTGQVLLQNDWVKWNGGYRLPTEAEWEKAARGGLSGSRFPWGNVITHAEANYYSCSHPSETYDISPTPGPHPAFSAGDSPHTSPVGYFSANGYGLYDMAGNVWQWCWDWYEETYYSSSPGIDPRGPAAGLYRVFRGGSWHSDGWWCRAAARDYGWPHGGADEIGFRTVLPSVRP